MALNQLFGDAEIVPCVDVPAALRAGREGRAETAVVPIENSVEGGVNATLDALGGAERLVIVAETLIPITFTLGARPGVALADVRRIGTHPHAFAQSRTWISEHIGEVVHVPATSTAAGAATLAADEAADRPSAFDAALCPDVAIEMAGLVPLATGVADNPNAVTRFVGVARPGRVPEPTGSDRTTLMVQLAHNESGGLLSMLEQFAVRGVNLSRIESRPLGDALGRYQFSVDVEGHIKEERIRAVLIDLHRVCPYVQFLGSYPTAQRRAPKLGPGVSDADFASARAWVTSLLTGEDA